MIIDVRSAPNDDAFMCVQQAPARQVAARPPISSTVYRHPEVKRRLTSSRGHDLACLLSRWPMERLKERIESLQTGLANLHPTILPPPRNKTASVVFTT